MRFKLSKEICLKNNWYSLENDGERDFIWSQRKSTIALKLISEIFSYGHDLILVYAGTPRPSSTRYLALKGDKGAFQQKIIPGWNAYAFPIRDIVNNDAQEKTISLEVSNGRSIPKDKENLGVMVNSIMITKSLPHLHHVYLDVDIKEKFNCNFPPLPTAILLDLTTRCNYSCPMCYRSVNALGNIDLDYKAILSSVTCFNDTKVKIDLSASGEPLLYPRFKELMKYLSCHKNIYISFVTNGFLIDKFLDVCLLAHSIGISLESFKNYNFTRKGGNVKKIISNIRLLKKHGLKSLCLQVIPMRFNLDELPDFIQFAKDNDLNAVGGQHLECFQKNDVFWKEQSCFFCQDEYNKIYKRIQGTFRDINFPPPFRNQQQGAESITDRQAIHENQILCSSPFLEARIDANGNVSFCCGVGNIIVGNIKETLFTKIWDGEMCRKIRNSILGENPICKCSISSLRGREINEITSAIHEFKN